MTAAPGPRRPAPARVSPGPAVVICPVCRESIPWSPGATHVYEWVAADGRYSPLDLTSFSEPKRSLRRAESFLPCPASVVADPLDQHYLPVDYHLHGPPIVIGLVGRPRSGKSHLMVAMLAELLRGAGTAYRITDARPFDQRQHAVFESRMLRPFLDGEQLPGTRSGVRSYAESMRLQTPSGTRTVVFFDIVGEEFARGSTTGDAEFLLAVSAVLFVEDVDQLRAPGNEWISGALAVLDHVPDRATLPAALVLTKADRERFTEPIDHWLRDPPAAPSADRFHEESRDLYAWLLANDASYLLSLVEAFPRCTLHVVSATGGAADGEGRYPRGVRPTRVLEPLGALLAAVGVLPGGLS